MAGKRGLSAKVRRAEAEALLEKQLINGWATDKGTGAGTTLLGLMIDCWV